MTLSEAAELVIQAGALSTGGEVFVLDMGEPVKIQHLAEQMIHLHGKEVKPIEATEVEQLCKDLERACEDADYLLVKQSLEQHVHGYTMSDNTVDPVLLLESKRTQGDNITPFREK